jgi:beta-lactamase superfamily II metal-dependent hydrolase
MLKIIIWDVQHGSSSYIRTPNNQHIVIDLGTGSRSDSTFSPLSYLKSHWQVTQLDCVVITHPHRDHLDDIFNFDSLFPKVLYRPGHISEVSIRKSNRDVDSDIISKYIEISNRYTEAVFSDPLYSTNNGGVDIQTFVPTGCSESNINNHSIVTVLSYAGSKILIPGDNEPVSWKELLQRNNFISAIKNTNILVAPHHGRDSGFCNELFDHISPDLTIISDGRFCDTSATGRYTNKTNGCTVYRRNGGIAERRCVTTRKDGVVVIEVAPSYRKVTID